jgi:hypothetical protein
MGNGLRQNEDHNCESDRRHSSVTSHGRESLKAKTKKGNQIMKNLNIQFKPTAPLLIPLVLAAFPLMFLEYDARAQSADGLPAALKPSLASEGSRYAEFNPLQIACYLGSMRACDKLATHHHLRSPVVFGRDHQVDTSLRRYGNTCGGRLNLQWREKLDTARFRQGVGHLFCTDIFPGH